MSDSSNERVNVIAEKLAGFISERFPGDSNATKNAALAVLLCTAAIDGGVGYAAVNETMKHTYRVLVKANERGKGTKPC